MGTYLEICQDVARESGTVPSIGQPETTTGATGRILRITKWVTEAYKDIQLQRQTWRWLRADFTGTLIPNTREYNAAAMGISERFSNWITEGEHGKDLFSIYLDSEGQETETILEFKDYGEFRRRALIGSSASEQQKPVWISINDQDELVFYPKPDAAYTVRGLYYKAPQMLTEDGHVPEMKAQYHDIIKWRALLLMGLYDEAFEQRPGWQAEFDRIYDQLTDNQLPMIRGADPLV